MPTPLTRAAFDYLSAGFSIIALSGKKPNSDIHAHGLSEPISGIPESPEDDALIEQLFTHPKTTGVGILIPEDYLVADIDTDEAAYTFYETGGEQATLSETPVAKTRNGLHAWFRAPGILRSVWVGQKTLLLRGVGSYVAAPPSRHPDGGEYVWLNPLVDEESGMRVNVAPLPAGIMERIKAGELLEQFTTRTYSNWNWALRHGEDGTWSLTKTVADADIVPLAKAVRDAKPGNRNNLLSWAVLTAIDEGITVDEALPILTEAALAAGLEPGETRTTILAAYRRRRNG